MKNAAMMRQRYMILVPIERVRQNFLKNFENLNSLNTKRSISTENKPSPEISTK